MKIASLAITILCLFADSSFAKYPVPEKIKSGGDLTVFNSSTDAFAKPSPTLEIEDLRKFTFGNKIFNTNWVTAPASVRSLDGLGPLFNRNSCSGCHTKDGRGRPPIEGEGVASQSILFRLSVLDENGNAVPHPIYGDQLNPQSITHVKSEGEVLISYEETLGAFADGKEQYLLRKPIYEFVNLNYGPLGDDIMVSPRVAPAVMGLGLLEAISEEDILANADENDVNNDGISGRPNYVYDQSDDKMKIGRFGWKSNQPTIKQQNAGAALGDMGITTSVNMNENCNEGQDDCKRRVSGGSPEMSDYQLDRMNFYLSVLAVPARRDFTDKDNLAGEDIFNKISCSSCHVPKFTTANNHEIKILRNQTIFPYTDLLLHDMGDDLADNRPDGKANGKEWRTPPLWGIGLVKVVNKHTNFLHDGRARNLEEAILWHGGEAEKSKNDYRALPKEDREKLLKFLESL